jgi:hypothetical protein
MAATFANPYRPGAGHTPPYLAGREHEQQEFRKLLEQDVVLANLILTGLRGVGKTVLLETFKPLAQASGWGWAGTEISESTSMTEASFATRLITDLSVVTAPIVMGQRDIAGIGFRSQVTRKEFSFDYHTLMAIYEQTPGLVDDKLKRVLELAWGALQQAGLRGMVFAYDEAQNMSDHASKNEYPLAQMLTIFQSIQRKKIPFMLVLTGLPTLFPKLVEARTFAERMFHIMSLERLSVADSRDAILKPITGDCPVFTDVAVRKIIEISAGYPYFIQFVCREAYDVFISQVAGGKAPRVPVEEILRKLDTDFFAGRWSRATDRQRELLQVIASLDHNDGEFTVQEIVERSRTLISKSFSSSHAHQMLNALSEAGLVYKNRHGKYAFAVPLLGTFIRRQVEGN